MNSFSGAGNYTHSCLNQSSYSDRAANIRSRKERNRQALIHLALQFHASVLLIKGEDELTQDFETNVGIRQSRKRNHRLRIIKAANANWVSQLRLLDFDLITD